MGVERLEPAEIEGLTAAWSEQGRRLALAARERVLELAPGLAETVAFGALCYFKAGVPYGVIGGNVCLIEEKHDQVRLAFLHGAALPDPAGLLEGTAKAKRSMEICAETDLRRPALEALIRAAVAYDPPVSAS